jgi:hypothetical protein
MPSNQVPIAQANAFKGLSTLAAALRLSRSIRIVLADDAARIRAETALEVPDIILSQLKARHNILMLLCSAALIVAYAYGTDAGGRRAAQPSLLVSAVFVLLSVALQVWLVLYRAHRLRWEVHGAVTDALLEFERACGLYSTAARTMLTGASKAAADGTEALDQLSPASSGGSTSVATTSGTNVPALILAAPTPGATGSVPHAGGNAGSGLMVACSGLWRALDFHEPSKALHAVPAYRDGAWVRLPVALLVKGDLIALMAGEAAPARVSARGGVHPT